MKCKNIFVLFLQNFIVIKFLLHQYLCMEGMGLEVHTFSDNNTKFFLVYITTPTRTEM